MSSVVLRNKSGNDVTYENVYHLNLTDGTEEKIYTDMTTLTAYYATYDDTTTKYTIIGQWVAIKGKGYVISSADANQATAYGALFIIFTTNKLVAGESYYVTELGGVM